MIERNKEVNISESVSVSVEAARMLGLDIASNPDLLTKILKIEYEKLAFGQNRTGELYIHPQIDADDTLMQMLDVIDNLSPNGHTYPKHNVWYQTDWTSGAKNLKSLIIGMGHHNKDPDSYKSVSAQARLAPNDGKNFMAKFAQYPNQPYNEDDLTDEDKEHGIHTQLESFALDRKQINIENPGFYLTYLDVASIAFIGLQKHIKGESLKDAFGVMTIPDLGHHAIKGDGRLRIVHFGANEDLRLGALRGDPSPYRGFGHSIGHE
jgi:hypothetical protein